tara:strand:- start:6225 stop:7034 length:810 start_codon:yes stop_codon:yes gene_type:complete
MVENNREKFQEHLLLKGLGDKTMQIYLIYYNKFPHDKPLDQGLINKFIVAHKNNNVVRAFISMLLNFLNRSDIKIQKKTGRKKQRIMQPLTMSEINTLAKACYDHSKKIGLMFELLFHLALRREEITTMQVTWFNWDQWIEDRSKPCRIGIIGKNNKQRHLLLSAFVTKKIKDYIQNGLDEKTINLNTRMFGMGNHRFWEIFVDVSKKTLGKRITPHQIRHTKATTWKDQGVPLEEIQRRLGHQSIQTTMIYLHVDEEAMLKSWEKEFI